MSIEDILFFTGILVVVGVLGCFVIKGAVVVYWYFFSGRSGFSSLVLQSIFAPLLFLISITLITFIVNNFLGIDFTKTNSAIVHVIYMLVRFRDISVVFCIGWFVLRLLSRSRDTIYRNVSSEINVALLFKIVQIVLFGVFTLVIVEKLGFNIDSVLAFGGIGGIAAGLAAKDTLANFFGALIITIDRPFRVGDMVSSSDREIEGVVMEIGWRFTKIRSFAKCPLYVPNSLFTTIILNNNSNMTHRRIIEFVKINYSNNRDVKAIIKKIDEVVANNEGVDSDQISFATVHAMGSVVLELKILCYAKTKD